MGVSLGTQPTEPPVHKCHLGLVQIHQIISSPQYRYIRVGYIRLCPRLQLHEGCILGEKSEEIKFPWISAYINSSYLERPWLCFAKRQGDLAG